MQRHSLCFSSGLRAARLAVSAILACQHADCPISTAGHAAAHLSNATAIHQLLQSVVPFASPVPSRPLQVRLTLWQPLLLPVAEGLQEQLRSLPVTDLCPAIMQVYILNVTRNPRKKEDVSLQYAQVQISCICASDRPEIHGASIGLYTGDT